MKKAAIKKFAFYVFLSVTVIAYFLIRLPELKQSFLTGITSPYDFPQDYIAGRQLLAGQSLYPSHFMDLYTSLLKKNGIPAGDHLKYINAHPPFTAMLLFPLWRLSFHNAIFLWSLLTIACAILTSFLLIKAADSSFFYVPLLFLFMTAWPPFQLNLALGQTSILITLFVVAGWYFLKKGKEGMSGIFIALATMLKFYPGLLILYFLISKKYTAFLYAIASIVIILTLTFLVTKYEFLHFFSSMIPADIGYWEAHLQNSSFNGFATKLFLSVKTSPGTGALTASISYFDKNLFLYCTEALLVLYGAWSISRYTYTGDLGLSAFVLASLLLSPLCWNHYLTLLLLPLIILIKELSRKNTLFEIVLFLAALFLVSIDTGSVYFQKAMEIAHAFISGNPLDLVYRLTFYSAQFYGMLLLLFLNFRMIKQRFDYSYRRDSMGSS